MELSQTVYAEFSYGFLTFSTHMEAAAAIEGLKNESQLREIIRNVAKTVSSSEKIISLVFAFHRGGTPEDRVT
jgi:hypothetical protein